MEVEREIKKMTLGHDFGAGAACLKCKDKCEGFELHFWRKICRNCKCGLADHDVQMNSEENKKVGKLFEDTKYTGLIAKLKTDGVPTYKGNMVTISLAAPATAALVPPSAAAASAVPVGPRAGAGPVGAGARPANAAPAAPNAVAANVVKAREAPVKSVTYEWAPPGATQYMAVRYIQLLPPEKRPVAGTEGAAYRRCQMARQLPEHDQDPAMCHELTPAEVKLMQQFVRKYKDEALGVGDIRLPEDMLLVQPGGRGGPGGAGPGGAGPVGVGPGGVGPGGAGPGGVGSGGAGPGGAGPGGVGLAGSGPGGFGPGGAGLAGSGPGGVGPGGAGLAGSGPGGVGPGGAGPGGVGPGGAGPGGSGPGGFGPGGSGPGGAGLAGSGPGGVGPGGVGPGGAGPGGVGLAGSGPGGVGPGGVGPGGSGAGGVGPGGVGPGGFGPGGAGVGGSGPGGAGVGGSGPGGAGVGGLGAAGVGLGGVGAGSGPGGVGVGVEPGAGPGWGSRPGSGSGPGVGVGDGGKGTASTAGQAFSCRQCELPMQQGEPAVYAERAGYDQLWHPACFVCCTCGELLVDMIYFWKKGKLYCGRHYGDSEKPRCGGCDELIFSNEYTQAEGQNWHLKHFCCFDCDCVLAGETYVMERDKPVCKPCYMKSHAVRCTACQNPVEPEAQRVSYGDHHWHAEPGCFQCSCCSKCLIGQRFMATQGMLFCSVECKKKTLA